MIYINDILEITKSDGLLFADDTKIFKHIMSREDALSLQADIDVLEEWSNTWLLKFNVLTLGKFENIRYTHRYSICVNELEHVFDEKDLGVSMILLLVSRNRESQKSKYDHGYIDIT